MIHSRIERSRPFGEDDDANNAIGSVLGLVEQLARETRKLDVCCISKEARWRQRSFVRDIRERVYSVADRHHVDRATFLEAARLTLGQKLGREIRIEERLFPGEPEPFDREDRRLRDEVSDIELAIMQLDELVEKTRVRIANLETRPGDDTALCRARERLDTRLAKRVDLDASLRIATLALAQYRVAKVAA